MLDLLRRIPHSMFGIGKPFPRADTSQQPCSHMTNDGRTALLERLPDELIIYILSLPGIEVASLHTISEFSHRLKCITVPIMLSKFQLTTVVDQEGRGKTTTHYSFCKYNMNDGVATFVASDTRPRRYKHTHYAAVPILRSVNYRILLEANDSTGEQVAREDHSSGDGNNEFVCHVDIPAAAHYGPSVAITKKTKSLRVERTGSQLVTSDERLLPTNQPLWQLGYLVSTFAQADAASRSASWSSALSSSFSSTKPKTDIYFTAAFIAVHVSTLFKSACPTASTAQAGRKRKRSSVHRMSASLQWFKRQSKPTADEHQIVQPLVN